MKSFMYAYAINTSHTKEDINVFSVKDLTICDINNGIQSRNELVLSGRF
jgi:hypothetical protein